MLLVRELLLSGLLCWGLLGVVLLEGWGDQAKVGQYSQGWVAGVGFGQHFSTTCCMQLARVMMIESFSGLVGSLHRWVRMLSTAVAGCNVAELIKIERGIVLDSASKRFPHCAMCRLDRVSLQSLQRRLKRGGIHLATHLFKVAVALFRCLSDPMAAFIGLTERREVRHTSIGLILPELLILS